MGRPLLNGHYRNTVKTVMSDYLIRATAAGLMIRAFAVDATNTVEEARRRHETSPVVTAALGRLLAAGAMMGSAMKGEEDLLTLMIRSDGPIKGMTVTANSHGEVKGYPLVPQVEIAPKYKGKLDVGGAIGPGTLTIIMDLGMKEPYSGQIELQTGEIGDDIAYYYTMSEQTPSAVGLGVMVDTDLSVKHAGGFMIQLMPDATEEVISTLEQRISEMPQVTALMEEGKSPEDILEMLLGDLDLKFSEDGLDARSQSTDQNADENEGNSAYRMPICFRCNCSEDRMLKALATIKKADLQEMIDDGEDVEVVCHFCNTKYNITVDKLKEIIAEQ